MTTEIETHNWSHIKSAAGDIDMYYCITCGRIKGADGTIRAHRLAAPCVVVDRWDSLTHISFVPKEAQYTDE